MMSRTRDRLVSALLLSTAFAVALTAILGTRSFNHRAESARIAEGHFIELRADLAARNAAEWQAIARGTVRPGEVAKLGELSQTIRGHLAELDRGPATETTAGIAGLFDTYERAVADEFAMLAAGRQTEAEEIDESIVDPTFERLNDLVSEARAAAEETETSARHGAGNAEMLLGLGATVIAAGLFAGYRKVQKRALAERADRAMVEQEIRFTRQVAEQRAYEANHDALTGLPNRRYLVDALSRRHNSADRGDLAVLLLDLDEFKTINDTRLRPILRHRWSRRFWSTVSTLPFGRVSASR
jgi:hypothetical protein